MAKPHSEVVAKRIDQALYAFETGVFKHDADIAALAPDVDRMKARYKELRTTCPGGFVEASQRARQEFIQRVLEEQGGR